MTLHSSYPPTSPCTIIYPPPSTSPPLACTVYCTDPISNTLTVTVDLEHTTLAKTCKTFNLALVDVVCNDPNCVEPHPSKIRLVIDTTSTGKLTPSQLISTFPSHHRSITEKQLLELEAHQNKLAVAKLRQANPRAGPAGMRVFEKLLKACGDVEWTRQPNAPPAPPVNILIDTSLLVTSPYFQEGAVTILNEGGLTGIEREKEEGNRERVVSILRDVKEGMEGEGGA